MAYSQSDKQQLRNNTIPGPNEKWKIEKLAIGLMTFVYYSAWYLFYAYNIKYGQKPL